MKITTFINRPILSCVLSAFVVILGLIGLSRLPMEQFPEIAPPTVRVSATYTGANPETLQRSVIAPLEEAINGVEGINYMTFSANNNGQATVTIYFRQGTAPDMAAVNVQNRIALAQGLLPAEVVQSGVTVRKSQNSTAKIVVTMILGLLPMIFARGVGSNGSHSLAIGVIGGMILGTIALLYITPAIYTLLIKRC